MNVLGYETMAKTVSSIQLYLGYAGYATVNQAWKTDRLSTPFNRLYLVESGEGMLYTEREEIVMRPGKAYLLPAGLSCSYRCPETMCKLFFHLNLQQPNGYDIMLGFDRIAVADISLESLQKLRGSCEGNSCIDSIAVTVSLYQILLDMQEVYGFAKDVLPAYSDLVSNTIQDIRNHLSAQLRVGELAKRQYVSRTHLSQQFHKEVGVSIGKYIDQQLMNEAQWQLSRTDDSVEKISSALGFCNQFYFSKCFKDSCGMSPLAFRKRLR